MALLALGNKFTRDLEKAGALGVRMPLEGGYEGRYRRRVRSAGYDCAYMTARGLGDLAAYLTDVHGVRPPHLGKKNMEGSAVGDRYFIPPIVSYRVAALPPKSKGLLLWLIEGHILSSQEINFLATLPALEPKVKVVVEVGGDRAFNWFPLKEAVAA
jgi:NAD(P)H-quinone oxidoreductase subunit N